MPRRCDLWRVGVAHAPVEVLACEGIAAAPIVWLPTGRDFTFDADPFGYWRDSKLYLFVEHYDYRSRHGVIDCLVLDDALRMLERQRILAEPWHLSYPAIFEADGSLWLLPEAHRSGALTLYRCRDFPFGWERAFSLPVDVKTIDATPFHCGDLWWLFFSSTNDRLHRMGSLHARWAERLEGPWHAVPPDPIRLDLTGARPAGHLFLLDGKPVLPVQDCSQTYGGAVRLLHFDRLEPGRVEVSPGRVISPPEAWRPFDRGLHTLNGCGPVTLIDAKQIDRSGRGWLFDAARLLRRAGAPRPG